MPHSDSSTVSAIDRQIQAYGDSAAAADSALEQDPISPEDARRAAQDTLTLLQFGIAMGNLIEAQAVEVTTLVNVNDKPAPAPLLPRGEKVYNFALAAMVRVRKTARQLVSLGYELPPLADFDDAILKVRDGICVIHDLSFSKDEREKIDDVISRTNYDAFAASSKDHLPPQSWFEEDFTSLRG